MNWVLKDGIKVVMRKKTAHANVVYSSNEEKLREWDMKPGSINCSSVIQGLIFYAEELESVGLTSGFHREQHDRNILGELITLWS